MKTGDTVHRLFPAVLTRTMTLGMRRHTRWGWDRHDRNDRELDIKHTYVVLENFYNLLSKLRIYLDQSITFLDILQNDFSLPY